MAYVDHAFSISDEDDLVGGAIGGPRGAPVKEIAFAAALLAFGALGAIGGLLMAVNRVGGDRAHGESETQSPSPSHRLLFRCLCIYLSSLSPRCEQLEFCSCVHPLEFARFLSDLLEILVARCA